MENILVCLPIIVSIMFLVITRKSLYAIGSGLITAVLIAGEFNVYNSIEILIESLKLVFVSNGELKIWNISIILFLPLLTIISIVITNSGGMNAFINYTEKKIKSKKHAEVFVFLLGVLLYIDGYFNAVIVGNVSRAYARSHKISRAKLAYIVDSTSAPICPLIPSSSWGAAILGIIGGLLVTENVDYSETLFFFKIIPYQFFTFSVLTMVSITILTDFKIGKMKKYDNELLKRNRDISYQKTIKDNLKVNGKISYFLLPIISLLFITILIVFIEGYNNVKSFNIVSIISNSNLALAMVYSAFITFIIQILITDKKIPVKSLFKGLKEPMKVSVNTLVILILAWSMMNAIEMTGMSELISDLLLKNKDLTLFLPFIIFIIGAFLSFISGTSWGTFYLLLPIAFSIGINIDINTTVILMAASISGSVFGDNCSLISDTTIISASATECHLHAHYSSQISYALFSGIIAAIGFLMIGLTNNIFVSYVTMVTIFVCIILINKYNKISIN